MWKKYPILKWSLLALSTLIILVVSLVVWLMSLLPANDSKATLRQTLPSQLPYLSGALPTSRGKILAVVSSHGKLGNSGKKTGYELTELSRPYYVFMANGFEVDIASPEGGKPPVVIDGDDMGAYDYAFLNDTLAQYKTSHTIPLDEVVSGDYEAVFFVGGKGAMFDFPGNNKIQSIVREYDSTGKVIGAVCHGPAALLNVSLANGNWYLKNKSVSGFTNEEELFLIPDAATLFPFLLQDALVEKGARFNKGHQYLQQVSVDRKLVTGQNPWSTWVMAEAMIKQIGHQPVMREVTAEGNTIQLLTSYEASGYQQAKLKLDEAALQQKPIDRNLLAMHGLVAAMQWKIKKTVHLIRLLSYAKSLSGE